MAVAFRSQNFLNWVSNTTSPRTLTAPAGVQNGDLLVIFCAVGNSGGYPAGTPPPGFAAPPVTSGSGSLPFQTNAVGFFQTTYIWTKIASGEPASYSIAFSASATNGFQVWIGAFTGVAPATPVEFCTTNTGGSTTSTALGATASIGDGVLFLEYDFNDTTNALSVPSGSTPTFTGEYMAWSASNANFVVAFGTMAAAGPTGNKAITNNNTGTDPWGAALLGLTAGSSLLVPPLAMVIS